MSALFIPIAAMLHTLGALIGAGFTTFAEIFYTEAAADGVIDHHERKYLRRMLHGLKFGMLLVLLSGFALIVLEYLVPDAPQQVLVAPFWAIQTLTLVVIVLGSLLSRKRSPWWFASAAILTGWWMILLIDLGYFNADGYVLLLVRYGVATVVVALVLGYVRVLVAHHSPKRKALARKDPAAGAAG